MGVHNIGPKANCTGTILLEAVLGLGLMVTGLVMNLELIQKGQWIVLLHHTTFVAVRGRMLGDSIHDQKLMIHNQLIRSLGLAKGAKVESSLKFIETQANGALTAKLWYRYPQFLPFPYLRGTHKHHMEVTAQCSFPF